MYIKKCELLQLTNKRENPTANSHMQNDSDFYIMDSYNKEWIDEHYGMLSQHC